jgi:tetratricopeptide (TPR) repeat protein
MWATMAWLAGCANTGDTASPPFMRPAAALTAFEQRHLTLARLESAEGDLAEAAYHWEVLTVLRPDQADYEEQLAQARAQIERKAAELTRLARQAQQKGALEEATQRYLSVLALQPDDKAAAQALRAIERERVKRDQLGRYSSRQLLQPRIPARKAPTVPANPAGTSGASGAATSTP